MTRRQARARGTRAAAATAECRWPRAGHPRVATLGLRPCARAGTATGAEVQAPAAARAQGPVVPRAADGPTTPTRGAGAAVLARGRGAGMPAFRRRAGIAARFARQRGARP